jgi:hypothetical protein
MSKKTESSILVTSGSTEKDLLDAFLEEADEILKLVKLRDTVSLGGKSTLSTKAQASLSKEITSRINTLSASIVQRFQSSSTEDES